MPKSTNQDFLIFFYSILAGAILCLLYDVFRAIRGRKNNGILTFCLDVIFSITAALVTFYMQFVYSNGQIRWYVLVGELAGFISTRISISRFFMMLIHKIINLLNIIIHPFKIIVSKLNRVVFYNVKIAIKKIYKIIKKFLKWAIGLLYNTNMHFGKRNAKRKLINKSKGRKSYETKTKE